MIFRLNQVVGIVVAALILGGGLTYWLGARSRSAAIQLGMSEADVHRATGTNWIYYPNLILIDTNEFEYDWDHEIRFWLLTTNPPTRLTFNLRSNLIGIESIKVETNGVPFPWSLIESDH